MTRQLQNQVLRAKILVQQWRPVQFPKVWYCAETVMKRTISLSDLTIRCL